MKNIAVIGCGYWGKNLVRNFHELGALHTICDGDGEVLKGHAAKYGYVACERSYRSVLKNGDIKAVAIATPAQTHFSLAREAIMAGKDIFVEKPLALKLDEARRIVELAERHKRVLMVDHLLHYHPAFIKLKELAKEGVLGSLQYIYSNRLSIGKIRKEENILWSFAPHDISVILSLVGKVPVKVDAFGEAYLQKKVYDTTLTTFTFSKRLKAHIYVSWLHPFKEQKLVVIGTKNMAVFHDQSEEKLVLFPHRVEWVGGIPIAAKAPHKSVEIESYEPLGKACEHFIECVEDRRRPITDGKEALGVMKVLDEAQTALERSR
ncbi:MAG: Gfo/Idh/MocA family oxidoreductase [Candidatus Omnitrophica bacterium]|nr:Gfo/Idh/MocA family oxidoreductase [Candidatus Omnitrophota bacterium]